MPRKLTKEQILNHSKPDKIAFVKSIRELEDIIKPKLL